NVDSSPYIVKMMFPMVTTLEELRRLKAMVHRAQRQLSKEGIPYGQVAFGMMLEVPAAAIMIDQMLPAVDFVSVG
ncbi:MAG TPA: phosphoenolpyruvate--protein phosphotransferase, partial [Planctomycetaceae bacterium]|nr:phosphoenolpyruvate--protein phosphotransferase [Planctomycetaceae bacterium]